MYWFGLAPFIFPYYNYHDPVEVFMAVNGVVHHTWPITWCVANIWISDIKIREDRWKTQVLVGLAYIPANYIGLLTSGKPLYPVWPVDWKNPTVTIIAWILVAFV